ncbi:MAG: CPBP family intramembrane glutamic endopeptidase [Bacteroidales bacterium]
MKAPGHTTRSAMLAGLSPMEKFLFVVIILFILSLAFQFLGGLLASLLYGFSLGEILNLETFDDPRYVAASKIIQIMGSIGTFIVPAFLFSYLFAGDWVSYYQFEYHTGVLPIVLTVAMIVAVIPFINYLAEINMRMELPLRGVDRILRNLEQDAEGIMRAFTDTSSLSALLVNLFMIGILAAVGEELIFRGLLQRLLFDMVKNPHVAIALTAIFFSAFHFQFFSFLPRFVLGLILGYLLYFGRSIWYPIVAHFVNNSLGVVYYFFNARGSADDMLEEIGTSSMMPLTALVSLILFALFFGLWYHYSDCRTIQSPQSLKTDRN